LRAVPAVPAPHPNNGRAGTSAFPNPGVTGGLTGRKRALLEGGIRVTGIVEAPWLVAQARSGAGGPLRLDHYASVHTDILPTLLELLNVTVAQRPHPDWPIDGVSLVPALTGRATTRAAPIGWISDFALSAGNATCPPGSPRLPPSAPAGFEAPVGQPQVAWMEGSVKLIGCRRTPAAGGGWFFRCVRTAVLS
jgi:hypothetical protein